MSYTFEGITTETVNSDSDFPRYLVIWSIDVKHCHNAKEAAEYALKVQRDPESVATVFRVRDFGTGGVVQVDLGEDHSCSSPGLGAPTNATRTTQVAGPKATTST